MQNYILYVIELSILSRTGLWKLWQYQKTMQFQLLDIFGVCCADSKATIVHRRMIHGSASLVRRCVKDWLSILTSAKREFYC